MLNLFHDVRMNFSYPTYYTLKHICSLFLDQKYSKRLYTSVKNHQMHGKQYKKMDILKQFWIGHEPKRPLRSVWAKKILISLQVIKRTKLTKAFGEDEITAEKLSGGGMEICCVLSVIFYHPGGSRRVEH